MVCSGKQKKGDSECTHPKIQTRAAPALAIPTPSVADVAEDVVEHKKPVTIEYLPITYPHEDGFPLRQINCACTRVIEGGWCSGLKEGVVSSAGRRSWLSVAGVHKLPTSNNGDY